MPCLSLWPTGKIPHTVQVEPESKPLRGHINSHLGPGKKIQPQNDRERAAVQTLELVVHMNFNSL